MPLSPDVNYGSKIKELPAVDEPTLVRDMSIVSDWINALTAGGPDGADNSGNQITKPGTQISATTARIVKVPRGTLAMFRMKYDDGVSVVSAAPVLNVFGRCSASENGTQGPWMPLQTREDTPSLNMTLTPDLTNDMQDGTYAYTKVDLKANTMDLAGCDEILVGVKTAFAGTGTVTNATVEMKVI